MPVKCYYILQACPKGKEDNERAWGEALQGLPKGSGLGGATTICPRFESISGTGVRTRSKSQDGSSLSELYE